MQMHVKTRHSLKLNHGCNLPRYIMAVDTETLPVPTDPTGQRLSHNLRLGVAVSVRLRGRKPCSEKVTRFKTADEFWQALVKLSGNRHTVWVVAHNLLFDFITCQLPKRLEDSEMTIDWPRTKRKSKEESALDAEPFSLAVISSPPTIIAVRIRQTQGRVVFVDSLNWFRSPLKEVGEQIGRPKQTMPPFTADDETWFNYCENDTRIVLDSFIGLIQWTAEQQFGVFRYTAASQSMAAYRHRFMKHRIFFHNMPQIMELERQSYFGGRSEVFRRGEYSGTCHQLDVSSLFPSVMQSNRFPVELERVEFRRDYLSLLPVDDLERCCAEVKLTTAEPLYPIRLAGKVVYPTGTFHTVLAGPELAYAQLRGHLQGIKTWAVYRCERIFTEFVDHLWQLRMDAEKSGNNMYAAFAKSIMNSLYGKWAELTPVWVVDPKEKVALPWSQWCRVNFADGETTYYRAFGWTAEKKIGGKIKRNTLCAISSWVTAFARKRMNMLRGVAGQRNVYYQGVDSLIVNDAGYQRLIDANKVAERELGLLRHQRFADSCEINGIGDYVIGSKVTIGGRAGRTDEVENGVFVQHKFIAREKMFANKAATCVDEVLRPWQRSYRSDGRTVDKDGYTLPLVLPTTAADSSSDGSCDSINNADSAATNAR